MRRSNAHRSSVLLCLAIFGSVFAVASAQEPEPYRVDAGDRLTIRCVELPELDGSHQVKEDGTLELPHVGTVLVRGLTEDGVARRIERDLLRQGLRQATISVAISEARAQPLIVLGAVADPGQKNLRDSVPLLDILLRSGGLTDQHGGVVTIRRRAGNGLVDELEIALADLIERGDPTVNVPVRAGDMVNVPPARQLTYYLVGEVEEKGKQTFDSNEEATLLKAIARVGGLGENASHKIRILREVAGGERIEIEIDYRRILAGKDPDVPLQNEDIIVIKEAFF